MRLETDGEAVLLGRLVAQKQSWVRLSRQRQSSEHPPGLAFAVTHHPRTGIPRGACPEQALLTCSCSDLISMRSFCPKGYLSVY